MVGDACHKKNGNHFPVFIHGGYRSATTWLWSKFRNNDDCLCFYEIFNEVLADLKLADIGESRPSRWRSHHPEMKPYMIEYAPLIGGGSGVPGFPSDASAQNRSIGLHGIGAALDADIKSYVSNLLKEAERRNKRPVLSCTGIIGCTQGLRDAFGGCHILVVRNLFHQWCSLSGQYRFGNDWFLKQIFHTLKLSDRDEFIARIANIFSDTEKNDVACWLSAENSDRMFCYTVAIHAYMILYSRRSSDIVINLDAIYQFGSDFVAETGEVIQKHTGITCDISDIRMSIDFPRYTLNDPGTCRELIATMIGWACDIAAASTDERQFLSNLISALWAAHSNFVTYTAGVREALAQSEKSVRSLESDLAGKDANLLDYRDEVGRLKRQFDSDISKLEHNLSLQIDRISADSSNYLRHTDELVLRLEREMTDKIVEKLQDLVDKSDTVSMLKNELQAQVARADAEKVHAHEIEDRLNSEIHRLNERLRLAQRDAQRAGQEAAAAADGRRHAQIALDQLAKVLSESQNRLSGILAENEILRQYVEPNKISTDKHAELKIKLAKEISVREALTQKYQKALEENARLRIDNFGEAKWESVLWRAMFNCPRWWMGMPAWWCRARVRKKLARKNIFNYKDYLNRYPDVAEAGMDPLQHYLMYGRSEGRIR